MTEGKFKEVCPNCASAELYYEVGGVTGKIYHCKECGYVGPLVVEADEGMAKAIKGEHDHEWEGSKTSKSKGIEG